MADLENPTPPLSDIQKWYSGRSIFITGGTGFMGKVLVEKLLRSCQLIDKVYLLVREKNGFSHDQRHKTMIELPLFDKIRKECPDVLEKLIFVEGNLVSENLGLSLKNRNKLIENVSVVFHVGASLKLAAGLRDAVLTNTLGTKMVLDLCCKMQKIASVVHLSTAFCHCNIKELKEQVYQPNQNPYEMIKLVLEQSDQVLDERKNEILEHHPNSYTFSKCLAEWIVKDYETFLPVCIVRPSVVIPALREPIPGWVDSLNGPTGIMVAAAKGVLRSVICREDYNAEIIPVDLAINGFIIASYARGIEAGQKFIKDGVENGHFVTVGSTGNFGNIENIDNTGNNVEYKLEKLKETAKEEDKIFEQLQNGNPKKNGGVNNKKHPIKVYNVTCPREIVTITWGDVLNRAKNLIPSYPYEWTLWYPDGALRTNKWMHWLVVVLFQWIPAIFIDILLLCIRVPTFMIRLQRKLLAASSVFEYFTTKVWNFKVESILELSDSLSAQDQKIFCVMSKDYDIDEYMTSCILGSRKFCMKEDESSLWFTRIHFKILRILHYAMLVYFWYWLIWYVLQIRLVDNFLVAVHKRILDV